MNAQDDTATFLDQALPWPTDTQPGWVNIHSPWLRPGTVKPIFPGYAFADLAGATNEVAWRVSKDNDIYACMSLQKDARDIKPGKRKRQAMRAATAAVAMRCFWLDADTKNFKDESDLLAQFGKLIHAVGLPFPSFINSSGGGFHFYWVLVNVILPAQWHDVAAALAQACRQHNFAADHQCTINPAQLMRMPGTYNHKYDPPRLAKIIHIGGLVRLEDIERVLAPFRGKINVIKNRGPRTSRLTLTGRPSQLFDGVKLGPKLDSGLEPDWKPARGDVAAVCPWFQGTLDTGGACAREPEWFEALKVSYHTVEGRETAKLVSENHPSYSEQETDEKYEAASASAETYGWPQCQTIQLKGAIECAGCQHLAKGKSPLNFVFRNAGPAPASGSTRTSSSGATTTSGAPFMPTDYRYDAKGRIEQLLPVDGKKDQHAYQVIYPVPVSDFKHQETNDEIKYGRDMMYFKFEGAKRTRPAQIPMDSVHDLRTFRSVLSKQGMSFKDHEAQQLSRFMVSFVQQLRDATHLSIQCEPYGWALKDGVEDAFTFDGTRFNCNGNKQIAPPDATVGDKFRAVGQLDVWKAACKLITDQRRPDLNALIACAFGAPLVQMTGHNGFVVSAYSTATGVQKSAAMRVSQAMWGHPVGGMAGLDDTNNFLNARLAALRHLPLFIDELKFEHEFRKAELMVLGITQGKSKGRLTRSSEMMETLTYNTLMVAAGNASLVQHIAEHAKTTTAGMARIFEFTVQRGNGVGMVDSGVAQALIGRLEHNYGTAGRVYAEFLGQNVGQVRDDVTRMLATINGIVIGDPEERFWVATIAILILGARYGNELGLTDIDIDQLAKFLLAEFRNQRRDTEASASNIGRADNVERFVVDYINARTTKTLKTDTVNLLPGRGGIKPSIMNNINHLPKGEITVHAVKDQHLLRISVADFGSWLSKERKVTRHEIIAKIKELLPAVEKKGSLGRGTHYAGANERLLEFDTIKMPDIDLF